MHPTPEKVTLITGASRGIGRAIAERLAQDGFAVVVNYAKSADQAQALVQRLTQQGGRALAVQGDVSRQADVITLFERAVAEFGRLDVLVNNAGIGAFGVPLENITDTHYDALFNTNVRGLIYASQAASQHFGDSGGHIINLSSVVGNRPAPYSAVYAATKAAVDSLTKSFAAELGPRRIRVNAVAPSLTETDGTAGMPAAFREHITQTTALGRLGTAPDIAGVVALLASPATGLMARFCTPMGACGGNPCSFHRQLVFQPIGSSAQAAEAHRRLDSRQTTGKPVFLP
ncbi:SDR family NAD(P)-dependent oxidoreductase [Hymenobacter terrenus]|uniref:SDR family NAD(P)-dependent oxidoreductase n=1 Tax=Hymenobacter terrenus TaxID=1629124 RepID=UPI000B328ABB|nr:SDR family oxidoreductase [Hymenobacter terrenus]